MPYALSTGASLFNQTFTTASLLTLAFGIVDLTDYGSTSELWLDNVKVTTPEPEPEPETHAMLFEGLGLLGFVARRRRNAI